jgi:hypothetical protein
MRRKTRKREVDAMLGTARNGGELSWTADARAYLVTSGVVAFLLAVFSVLLPAAA